ncbi:MAG: diaminobutyrate--2-oxoglutarate transaminase [Myxococcota bacterium]
MGIFERRESDIRSYCRTFDTVFTRAKGSRLQDEDGRSYIDLFAGAGSLNYGHNDDAMKRALLAYVEEDSVTHSLDMHTRAKATFLERFEELILEPRDLDYKLQFSGPTGTNSIEAALKLARKVTGRSDVVAFTNGFHGMTLGALAATGNEKYRKSAGVQLHGITRMPFDGYHGPDVDTLELIRRQIDDPSSGVDAPAAFLLETVQAEGGIHVASAEWLQGLEALARQYDSLLVVDDIQVGCGRTGRFFSFEAAGIRPDLVCLSKSLSGYGLPFAVVLIRPALDEWSPGEHSGTFRGHNLAFVTATEAMEYWRTDALSRDIKRKADHVRERLLGVAKSYPLRDLDVRGRGLIQGIDLREAGLAGRVSAAAFERGVIVETAGALDNVVKLLPPLTIDRDDLDGGLDGIEAAIRDVLGRE